MAVLFLLGQILDRGVLLSAIVAEAPVSAIPVVVLRQLRGQLKTVSDCNKWLFILSVTGLVSPTVIHLLRYVSRCEYSRSDG